MTINWEDVRRNAFYTEGPTPDHWPNDVRPVSFDGLSLLGLDRNLNLHWDGRRIEYHLGFTFWQKVLAWTVGISAGVVAVAAVLALFGVGPSPVVLG